MQVYFERENNENTVKAFQVQSVVGTVVYSKDVADKPVKATMPLTQAEQEEVSNGNMYAVMREDGLCELLHRSELDAMYYVPSPNEEIMSDEKRTRIAIWLAEGNNANEPLFAFIQNLFGEHVLNDIVSRSGKLNPANNHQDIIDNLHTIAPIDPVILEEITEETEETEENGSTEDSE